MQWDGEYHGPRSIEELQHLEQRARRGGIRRLLRRLGFRRYPSRREEEIRMAEMNAVLMYVVLKQLDRRRAARERQTSEAEAP